MRDRTEHERELPRRELRSERRITRAFGLVISALGMLLVAGASSFPGYVGPSGEPGSAFRALGYALAFSRER